MAKSSALSTSNQYVKYTIEVIQNSQNVTNNTSNVTVKVRFYRTNTGYETYGNGTVYCKINGTTYSAAVTSSQKITESGIVLFTKTLNITHNTDGTKTLTCSAWISISVLTSSEQSYSQALTTIPRKSTLSVSEGTLGTAQTLKVTRQSTSFTHTITYTCGSASGTICTKSTDTSISFTPPLSLASENTSGNSVDVKYTITTYNGSTSIGSNNYTKKCAIPASVKPGLSVSITDASDVAWGAYIQSVSRLAIQITPTLAYGSPIESYTTTIDGKTYTSSNFTTEVLKGKGALAITVTITDKRGNPATYNGTVNVLAYAMPAAKNLSVARCNSDGTVNNQGEYAKLTFTQTYSPISGNTPKTTIMYKKQSASAFTTHSSSAYNNNAVVTKIIAADTSSAYEFKVVTSDTVCEQFEKTPPSDTVKLGTINKFMSWFKNIGISFGKMFDTSKPNTMQVGWDAHFDKNVYIKDIPVRAKRCVCGQNGNSDENPWHKFASVTAKELNEDMRISFKLTFAYGSVTRFGTLDVFVRTENASGANAYQNIIFESDTGLDASNFVLAYSGTGVGAVYELWVKLSAYRFCQFEVLTETSRMDFVDRWQLYNSISLGEAAAPTSGYTQISATRPATSYAETVESISGGKVNFPDGIHTDANIVTEGTTNVFGRFRFNNDWAGIYPTAEDALNNTDRAMWWGVSAESALQFTKNNGAYCWFKFVSGDDSYIMTNTEFYPYTDNTKYLGLAKYRWKAVYSVNGTIQTSDRNQKKDIEPLEERYIDLFERLNPVSFRFDLEGSDRVHVGFISQDVKEAMDEVGLSDMDFAAYCRDKKFEENEVGERVDVLDENGEPVYLYSLRYQEFIALNTKMIQLTRQKVAEQQAEIDELKGEVAELRKMVESLTKQ